MKLHLPKLLFTAVLAAAVGVPVASAGLESKTFNVNGTDVVMDTYTGAKADNTNINPQTQSTTTMVGFEMTGGYFANANLTCSKDIYISKGSATGDTKTGLVLNDGNEYKEYTFTGSVYGNGDIYKTATPSNGLTLKFTGNMSAYTGAITIDGGNGKNKLIFDGATTGTGTITANCAITLDDATISNSNITTTGNIDINGTSSIAANTNVTIKAAKLNLLSTLNTSATGAGITLGDGTLVNMSKDVVLKQQAVSVATGKTAKLSGNGVYDMGTAATIATGLSLDTSWTGTVVYGSSSDGNALSTNLEALGNANSVIKLQGAGGHFATSSGSLSGRTLELANKSDGTAALTISNGSSGDNPSTSYIAAKIKGNGTVDYTFQGQGTISRLTFEGDVSDWSGLFKYSKAKGLHLRFGGAASEVNAEIKNASTGTLSLFVGNTGKKTAFNNTVDVSTISIDADNTMSIGGTITTADLTLNLNSILEFAGGVLNVTESYTLNAGCITLADGLTFTTADDYTLFNVTGANNTLTIEGLDSWSGSNYLIDGVEYSTALLQDGNSLKLTFKTQTIPEPTTATLSLLALAGLAARRRRK